MGHQEGRNRGYLSGKYREERREQEKLRSHVLEQQASPLASHTLRERQFIRGGP